MGPRTIRHAFLIAGFAEALASACCAPSAWALEGISVQFKFGMSSFNLSAGQSYQRDGGMGLEMRSQINYEVLPIDTSFAIFDQGHLGSSSIGSFPVSRVGIAAYYYPFGHPLSTMPVDDNVSISQARISPFVSVQGAYASISITDKTVPTHVLAFNGSAIAFLVGGGVEMPLGQSTSILGEILYEGTLAGGNSDTTGSLTSSGLSYSTFGGLLGVSIHP